MLRSLRVVVLAATLPIIFAGTASVSSVGTTTRLSVDSFEGEGNGRSYTYPGGMSDDGRYVAIQSYASNLVLNDHNQLCSDSMPPFDGLPEDCGDIFVRDTQMGTTELVTVSSSEEQANKGSQFPSVSDDGRFVVFQSLATNLVAPYPQINGAELMVYVRDRVLGITEIVSVDSTETIAGDGGWASISGDGRFVAFGSNGNLVPGDTNGQGDIYVRDRLMGTTERVSIDSDESQVSGGSETPSISDDGMLVAFRSSAVTLVPGDTNGKDDIFVRDRSAGTTERVSVDSAEAESNGTSWDPTISGNGLYVAFASRAGNLVAGDTNTCSNWVPSCPDIFVRDRGAGTTSIASLTWAGSLGNGPSSSRAAISDNGRYVAFDSEASNLAQFGDTSTDRDVFLRDRQANTTTLISVNDAGIKAVGASYNGGISSNGQYVGFTTTACNLVVEDQNGESDAFVRDTAGAGGSMDMNCAYLDRIAIDTQDDATPANTALSIGSTEACSRVANDDVLNFDEDGVDTIDVDVIVGPNGVPAERPVMAFQYDIVYSAGRLRLNTADHQMMLAATPGSSLLDVSDPLPDVSGSWTAAVLDTSNGTGETGAGVLNRLTFEAQSPGYSPLLIQGGWTGLVDDNGTEMLAATVKAGTIVVMPVAEPTPCTDSDGDGIADGGDNCPALSNPDQLDSDGDGMGNDCEPDDDNAGVYDVDEVACGGDPIVAALRPERVDGPFAGVDDDGDTQVDEPLLSGTGAYDCDGDGFKGSAEDHVFSYLGQTNGNQKTCQEYDMSFPNPSHKPSKRWPADLNGSAFSLNKINISDLAAFTNPVRYLNQDVGTDLNDVRLDLVPGSAVGADINVADMAALTTGATAYPAMLDGAKAFNGPECPYAP